MAHTSHVLPLPSGYDRQGSGTSDDSAPKTSVQVLLTVLSWRLVLMLADALLQKLRHPEVRITQQGRNAHDGRHHLSIESPATVANQKVRLFTICQFADELDSLLRVHRQVGRYHLRTTLESLAQRHRRYALATGIESVQEQDLLHAQSF